MFQIDTECGGGVLTVQEHDRTDQIYYSFCVQSQKVQLWDTNQKPQHDINLALFLGFCLAEPRCVAGLGLLRA